MILFILLEFRTDGGCRGDLHKSQSDTKPRAENEFNPGTQDEIQDNTGFRKTS